MCVVYLCTQVCVLLPVWVYTCGGQRSVSGAFLCGSLYLFLLLLIEIIPIIIN